MKKDNVLMIAALGLAFVALPAFAEEVTTTSTPVAPAIVKPVMQQELQRIQQLRKDAVGGIKDMRGDLRQDVKTIQQNVRVGTTTREDAKKAIEARRADFKQQVDIKKEEAKKKIESEKTLLKEKLKAVKDEKKKQAVQKVNDQINALNAKRLEHFTNVLNQIEDVLKKVGSRADKAALRGLDVGVVKTNMTAVEASIAAARAAIVAQSSKTYTINITTEGELKNNTGAARQALHADLATVRDLVKVAHEALRTATVSLAKVPRVDQNGAPVATSTAPVATTTATTTTSGDATTTATSTTN